MWPGTHPHRFGTLLGQLNVVQTIQNSSRKPTQDVQQLGETYKRAMVLLKVHWKTLKTLDCVSKVLHKVWVIQFCVFFLCAHKFLHLFYLPYTNLIFHSGAALTYRPLTKVLQNGSSVLFTLIVVCPQRWWFLQSSTSLVLAYSALYCTLSHSLLATAEGEVH